MSLISLEDLKKALELCNKFSLIIRSHMMGASYVEFLSIYWNNFYDQSLSDDAKSTIVRVSSEAVSRYKKVFNLLIPVITSLDNLIEFHEKQFDSSFACEQARLERLLIRALDEFKNSHPRDFASFTSGASLPRDFELDLRKQILNSLEKLYC